MSIDKESTGFPEMNVHRRTTKVNLSMIVAIGVFFVIVFTAVFIFARKADDPVVNRPAAPTENASSPAAP